MARLVCGIICIALVGCASVMREQYGRIDYQWTSDNYLSPEKTFVDVSLSADEAATAIAALLADEGATGLERVVNRHAVVVAEGAADCWLAWRRYFRALWSTYRQNDFTAGRALKIADYVPADQRECPGTEEDKHAAISGWHLSATLDERSVAVGQGQLELASAIDVWVFQEEESARTRVRVRLSPVNAATGDVAGKGQSIPHVYWPHVDGSRESDVARRLLKTIEDENRAGDLARRAASAATTTAGGSTPAAAAPPPSSGIVVEPPTVTEGAAEVLIRRLAVPGLTANKGAKEFASMLSEIVANQAGRAGQATIVGMSDINSMLSFEKQKDLLGCTDDVTCVAEIGGALGVDAILVGSIAKFGATWVLSAKIIDINRAQVLVRTTGKVKGDPDALIDLGRMVTRALVGAVRTAAPKD